MIEAMGHSSFLRWPLPAQAHGSFWLPDQASAFAPTIDWIFYFILAVCAAFFTLVVCLMVLFVIRYRRRPGREPGKTAEHNTPLEITWTVIPLLILGVIFYLGFTAFMDLKTAPPGSYEIRVSARQWKWQFIYPNGYNDEDLHVPVGEPVKLTMTSEDVIHSLSIPFFRVKMDLVPGRYTSTWFRAVQPGTYQLYCTEYCGDNHSGMLASVIVHKPGEFEKWLKKAGDFLKNLPPAEAGKILFQKKGCSQCHSVIGAAGTGPTLKGVYGKNQDLEGGGSALVDDNYIRDSILDPQKQIVAGFQPVMSTYKGLVSDRDITALIEYIKTLK
jgi:cytochrome c oxidase subunit 2